MPSSYQARLRHAKHYEQLLRQANELYKQGGDALLRGLAEFDLAWENIHSAQCGSLLNLRKTKSYLRYAVHTQTPAFTC